MKTWITIAMVGLFVGSMAITGCEKKDETAGQKLDKAVDATKDATKDAAAKTGDALKDAGDKLKDAAK